MTTTAPLALAGANHVAYTTWKPAETVHFYRDVMGLPLVHVISAKGWGVEGHPDFVHFFFDTGRGSHIAFFYYFGLAQPHTQSPTPDELARRTFDKNGSRHLAFNVETELDLAAWRSRLKAEGIKVTRPVDHEIIQSIYFRDPNGLPIEIARPLRQMLPADALDGELTMQAFLASLNDGDDTAEGMWRRKGKIVAGMHTQTEVTAHGNAVRS